MISRLSTLSQHLVKLYEKASHQQRKNASTALCVLAVKQLKWQEPDVEQALELVRFTRYDQELMQRLEAISFRCDDEHVRIMNSTGGDIEEAETYFRKSRVADALVVLLADGPDEVHEALYEAIMAMEDPEQAVSSAGAFLET